MIQRLRSFVHLFFELHAQEAAKRAFMHAVFEQPSLLPLDYEQPAYLRRQRMTVCC